VQLIDNEVCSFINKSMKYYSKSDSVYSAAIDIMYPKKPSAKAPLNESKYGKDLKVQKIMDQVQELEPGPEFTDLLDGLAEWATTAYGDLQKLRGADTPLGSQLNLNSWKAMAQSFDKLSELEWGEDPEPTEESLDYEEDEEREDTDVEWVANNLGVVDGDRADGSYKIIVDGDYYIVNFNKHAGVVDVKPDGGTASSAMANRILGDIQHRRSWVTEDTTAAEEEDIDIEWIESNFTVVTDDDKGNPTIEWTDGNWYRILLNGDGNVVNVEPREDDPGATQQNATKILRAIQHRIVAEDTTAASVATNPAPLGKIRRRKY